MGFGRDRTTYPKKTAPKEQAKVIPCKNKDGEGGESGFTLGRIENRCQEERSKQALNPGGEGITEGGVVGFLKKGGSKRTLMLCS